MSDSKKPAAKVSLYPVSAAIWRNDNGKGEAFYNVTFERRYRDDSGKWHSTSSFSLSDLLLLAKVSDLAHTEIHLLRTLDKQAEPVEA